MRGRCFGRLGCGGVRRRSGRRSLIAPAFERAEALCAASGQPERVYAEWMQSTLDSWSRKRRVIGKAEHLRKGANPRFVVTSIASEEIDARELYEDEYCARGEMENRIKEQQLCLFADRTSAASMRANQLRLWLSSVAYTLLQVVRQVGLESTPLARARCDTGSQPIPAALSRHLSSFRVGHDGDRLLSTIVSFRDKMKGFWTGNGSWTWPTTIATCSKSW